MKKVLLILTMVLITLVTKAQIGASMGLGGVRDNNAVYGMTGHMDFSYRFHPLYEFPQIQQQASFGLMYSSFNNKSIYAVKYGAIWENWMLNLGGVLINQDLYNQKGEHYIRAVKTFIAGIDYNFKPKKPGAPNFYVGGDYTDKDLYLKIGIRFVSPRSSECK